MAPPTRARAGARGAAAPLDGARKKSPPPPPRHFGRALKSFDARVATGADDPFTRYYIACLYALRGDTAHALDSLERVALALPALTAARARNDVDLESLRNEPRFQAITAPR